ncbi:uncharacterized protein BDCG_17468 [Blastomyces dermatitidis ER-3]|uniref:Uncharacterized protein n=1 Tax=Ajellomyces dermatitidis (strain ER-3 / ATCC MYA-2586) TaxID=559297 RepID=A0ABX2VYN1_AJEDR|nr:uncharacterized protein BDCG_17468 [Blastomyces dermatitidis ER-3]OAT02264.1 hypothetical protein BDCG_17468 [Blastomyces dermatitidis ER-3]
MQEASFWLPVLVDTEITRQPRLMVTNHGVAAWLETAWPWWDFGQACGPCGSCGHYHSCLRTVKGLVFLNQMNEVILPPGGCFSGFRQAQSVLLKGALVRSTQSNGCEQSLLPLVTFTSRFFFLRSAISLNCQGPMNGKKMSTGSMSCCSTFPLGPPDTPARPSPPEQNRQMEANLSLEQH